MIHHAIVVTGITQYHDSPTLIGLEAAHAKASEIFRWVSPISAVDLYGYLSFFVPPDGGRDLGDERRKTFTDWLRTNSKCQWVEVSYE